MGGGGGGGDRDPYETSQNVYQILKETENHNGSFR
jgi:hypothetical protein